jgi:hypothetical protein
VSHTLSELSAIRERLHVLDATRRVAADAIDSIFRGNSQQAQTAPTESVGGASGASALGNTGVDKDPQPEPKPEEDKDATAAS